MTVSKYGAANKAWNLLGYCVVGIDAIKGESLVAAIEAQLSDDASERADQIAAMAREAGISESTVTEILRGEINCPPRDRLEGFARALSISLQSLITAAERDGCNYGGDDD